MKKLAFLLLCLCVSFLSHAQNQVATLQHNDTITGVYYGSGAFVSAYNAAVEGDVITLSSGSFNGGTLNKAVTIRGAGCDEDTVTGLEPTIISSEVRIESANNSIPLTIEGVRIIADVVYGYNSGYMFSSYDARNVILTKCLINKLTNASGRCIYNLRLNNCIIKNFYFFGASTTVVNSVLCLNSYSHVNQNENNNIYNTFIIGNNIHLNNSLIYNSIISTGNDNSVTNTTFHNCIGIQTVDSVLFEGQLNTTNMTVNSYEEVFETFTGEVTFDNIYQLKQNVASSFLGNDGTEVGIYGGVMPYRTRPNYMIIKNCNVAGRTTEDNKLSVEIELFNAGE